MDNIFFTICIPSYNRSAVIIHALKSILFQSFVNYEVLIVDDGSTDNSYEVINSFINENKCADRFHYYRKNNGGKYTALNYGIKNAKGRYFFILDSDDWLVENALQKIYLKCIEIDAFDNYVGILGRTYDESNHKMIGDNIPPSFSEFTYLDYHFLLQTKVKVNDCFEVLKTKILQKFSFPEIDGVKFIPEAYIFDQIGALNYKLKASNEIFRKTVYHEDGMSMNKNFKSENCVGFLYHYISRIKVCLKHKPSNWKRSFYIKAKVLCWYRYYECVKFDKNKKGPRIKFISPLGIVTFLSKPILKRVLMRY